MEILHAVYDVIGGLVAVGLLVMIAFPKRFSLPYKPPAKVGPTYWGAYEGTSTTDAPEETTVQPPKPAGQLPAVTGSSVYEAGRHMPVRGTFQAQ
jgi:hypothetical protein